MPKLDPLMKHFNVKKPEVVTAEQMHDDWFACYHPGEVFNFPRGLTIFDFIDSTDVPIQDRAWAALKWAAAASGERPTYLTDLETSNNPSVYALWRVWYKSARPGYPEKQTVKVCKAHCRVVLRKYKAAVAKEAKVAAKAKAARKKVSAATTRGIKTGKRKLAKAAA